MIQALHNAGIGVIMDVVYNHTYTSDSWLQRTVPNYYYRMNNDGTFKRFGLFKRYSKRTSYVQKVYD